MFTTTRTGDMSLLCCQEYHHYYYYANFYFWFNNYFIYNWSNTCGNILNHKDYHLDTN